MHEQTTPAETARIPLRRHDGTVRAYVIVDAADYEWLMRWTWCLAGPGYAMRYERQADRQANGRTRQVVGILMHRQILGLEPGDPRQGDHENLNRLDCRRSNLRIAERAHRDNMQNTGSRGGSSRYRGVTWDKRRRKWKAQAMLDGKGHHLGRFADEDEAAAVASAWRAEHMPFSEDAAAAS